MTIQRFVETTNGAWVLRAIDNPSDNPIKEGVLDVELVNQPLAGQGKGQHRAHRGWFDNKAECLIKVDARTLSEPTNDPTCFVTL